MQQSTDTCGPACGRLILGYYGINVAEYDFQEMSTSLAKNYEDYTYASVIARTLNYYLGANGNSIRYQDKYFNSYSAQGFTDYVLQNIMNDRPVQIPVVIDSTTYFPYTSGGHYVVIKGMQYSSSSEAYNSMINDPHYHYSNVYTVPINVIRSYNLAHSGCMICPTE